MINPLLRLNDGMQSGRSWLRNDVKRLQHALSHAGHLVDVDGYFGTGTADAVAAFQRLAGIPATGIADSDTWRALPVHFQAAFEHHQLLIARLLIGFRGDLGWVHDWEGHNGRPYWPGGESGVTLDPGVDLGHAEPEYVRLLYRDVFNAVEMTALESVFGIKGVPAKNALDGNPELQLIRVSKQRAEAILPHAAKHYWNQTIKRFPGLLRDDALGTVHTVMLSLAYNRGPDNSELSVLSGPIESGEWWRAAELIGAMQQDHTLIGIRTRRQMEAQLILAELADIKAGGV